MHPGDIVAGKYRVASILGRSRGLLLEAQHTEFDQQVVIRLLQPHLCDENHIERFRREARTLAKLESEHVARIIDVGTHSDGSFFLARQHLEGVDLATHIASQGALGFEESVLMLLHVSEAVQESHSHNIILRELQPSHLFITRKRGGHPTLKLIDFGTAKLLKDPATVGVVGGESSATVMFGMSRYSSPELVRKVRGIDGRTDVWSLGCILYEMLAAIPPFQGEMAELMLKITREEPTPITSLRPDLPPEFDQIIGWALAKERESRFSSVYALAHALRPYTSAEGHVLIDQIGRLAQAEPESHAAQVNISPTSPLARRSSTPPVYAPEQEAISRRYEAMEQEQLSYPPSGYLTPDQHSPHSTPGYAPGSIAPPAVTGSVPPPSVHDSVPAPRARTNSWIDHEPIPPSSYPDSVSSGQYQKGRMPARDIQRIRQRKLAVIAIAAALVLLPVLVVVLVFALRRPSPPPQPEPPVPTQTEPEAP